MRPTAVSLSQQGLLPSKSWTTMGVYSIMSLSPQDLSVDLNVPQKWHVGGYVRSSSARRGYTLMNFPFPTEFPAWTGSFRRLEIVVVLRSSP